MARTLHEKTKSAEEVETRKRELPINLILSDGSRYPHPGRFDFIDRHIDPNTGAILVQASFPNPEGIIRPGQFARVRVLADTLPDSILIPQRCIVELQGTYRVFVVDDSGAAHERRVVVGPMVKGRRLVTEGLKPGEKVIYEGLQKVSDGITVAPEPAVIPSTEKEKT